VVHSEDGTDEISIGSRTAVREVRAGEVTAYEIAPEDFGVARSWPDSMKGGDPETNARILNAILEGQEGPARDAVVINAAAALYAANRAATFQAALNSGAARTTLERLRTVSQGARASMGGAA